MSYVVWDPSLETGDARVDTQHMGLFELLNELHTAVVEQRGNEITEEVIFRLMRYAATHFEDEEALMEHYGYPGLAQHRLLHRELARETTSLAERYMEGRAILPLTISMFLHDWLLTHIRAEDMKAIEFINEKRPHLDTLDKHPDDPWTGPVRPWKKL